MITLKTFQQNKIDELRDKFNYLVNLKEMKTIVFKSPTGSGKTIMMAEFIKKITEDRIDDKSFSFIWAAPRKLHIQSKKKLEKYFSDNRVIKCSLFEDLTDKCIGENEILFINWESINKKDNIYIKENENDINLSNIILNTKDKGRHIILIIDESHHTAQSDTSKNLIKDIGPKITLNVSATADLVEVEMDALVKADLEDVKGSGMIKQGILINPELDNVGIGNKSSDEMILDEALKMREHLKKKYEDYEENGQIGRNINPLLLIQLPDRQEGVDDKKEEIIELLKQKYDITIDNGKLAIYLSEEDENLENISKNDSNVEVLIFKQAIALGWDCPRASILVLFRNWQSIVFSIQTVGRIMRMPEFKTYKNCDELNYGYVYTNLETINIQEDIASDYIAQYMSRRKTNYNEIGLLSYHIKRQREKTRLSPLYINYFINACKTEKLKEEIDIDVENIRTSILVNGKIEDIDKKSYSIDGENKINIDKTEEELQLEFEMFIREAIYPLYPEKRSIGRVKSAIYKFFNDELSINYEYEFTKIINIVLNNKNKGKILNVINKSIEEYLSEVNSLKDERIEDPNWNVPLNISYSDKFEKIDVEKSIMQPFFLRKEYRGKKNELKFIKGYLENNDNIKWWFKNAENDSKYFSISYEEDNRKKLFYVDFIVMYKDNRIGLFDTKSGFTQTIAKGRAEGLAKYIKQENVKGKNIFGGIVVEVNGSWRINSSENYKTFEEKKEDWKFL